MMELPDVTTVAPLHAETIGASRSADLAAWNDAKELALFHPSAPLALGPAQAGQRQLQLPAKSARPR